MEEICKNCSNHFQGAFCNRCGQKVAHRLNSKHILQEAVHVFTHTDRGIFALIPALLFRSGQLAREYVQGKRKRHFNLFQYLIIIVGLALFIISQFHIVDVFVPNTPAVPASKTPTVQQEVISVLQQYFNLFLLLSIPIFSFFSWLFFKSKRYNYAENFVLQAAIQAQIHTYSVLVIFPLFLLFKQGEVITFGGAIILAGSNTLANHQFFRVSWAQAFFKGFLISISTNLVQVLLVFLVVMAVTKW